MGLNLLTKGDKLGGGLAAAVLFVQSMLFGSLAIAQDDIPSLSNKCFNDHGHLLRKRDRAIIRRMCKKAEKSEVPMMVVTVQTIGKHNDRPMGLDSFVTDVFDEWDIEYDQANLAILLFVSRKEHQIRIKLGDGYPDKAWNKAKKIMVRTVGPLLGRNPSAGIRKGFARLYKEVVKPYVREQKRKEDLRKSKRGRVNFE